MITKRADAPGGPEQVCCLHIGLPKTATKTLQMQLFARHSQVEYLGTYTGSRRQYRQCRDAQVEGIMAELIWDFRDRPDFARASKLFAQAVRPAMDAGRLPVWSWESLVEDRHEVQRQRAENLKTVFGDAKIIVGIRHPVRLVESLYLQLLKRDNVGARASFRRGVWYLPIDKWLARQWGRGGHPPKSQLEYARAIEIFADVFGDDRMGIFLFEQLVADPADYVRSICGFLEIDAAEGVAHTRDKRENARWVQEQLDRLQRIQQSPVLSTAFRFADKKTRRQMLGIPRRGPAPEGPPARAEMSDLWRERIEEKSREGNRRLAQRWNVPLAKYGYPL